MPSKEAGSSRFCRFYKVRILALNQSSVNVVVERPLQNKLEFGTTMFMVKTCDRFASDERWEASGRRILEKLCVQPFANTPEGKTQVAMAWLRRGPLAEARLRLKRMWLPLGMPINECAIPMELFKSKKRSRRTR